MSPAIPICSFRNDPSHFADISLLVAIKSFDLQSIRRRYLKSRSNKTAGRAGSVERREPAQGGIARVDLHSGEITYQILHKLPEPRAIDSSMGLRGYAAESVVHIEGNGLTRTLENPWFSYIHTIAFQGSRLLVSSSGYDCLLEFDLESLTLQREWFAWEHGFDRGWDAKRSADIRLTRDAGQAKAWASRGIHHQLITPGAALPTAARAAFINSATYATNGDWMATFFHEGKVYRIDQQGGVQMVMHGLRNPHGGREIPDGYMATSTADGEIVMMQGVDRRSFSVAGLPGKPEELGDQEWVQNSLLTNDGVIVAIDSNRNAFVLFDPEQQVYAMVGYPDNWAVQDLVSESGH